MLDTVQSSLLVVLIVGSSLGCLALVHRIWPAEARRQHNDLIGWQITVLGTTYAVIIGFMLYAVWTSFEVATGNAEAEANALVNAVRAAQALPAPHRQEITEFSRKYVQSILTEEWPAMSHVTMSPESNNNVRELWSILAQTQVRTASEQISLDHTYSEISKMTEHRRLRHLEVYSDLPGILWAVLSVGAVVTILSACLFGSADFKLQAIQVTALSLILSLLLVAIADINRPFQGSVCVTPMAFEHAQMTINDLSRAMH